MDRPRARWRADHGTRALKRLAQIDDCITSLGDEDLLDLADIFSEESHTPLNQMARAEMARRNIKL